MRAFIFFVIFATSLAITTGRVANRACPTKVVPTCKDGIYCKNLIKDKNGCPGADFCAATSAGTYQADHFRLICITVKS